MQTQDLVVLKTFADASAAAAAKWKLNAAGIQAAVSETASGAEQQQLTVSGGRCSLLVDEQQVDRARQVLGTLEPTVLEAGQWLCAGCGESGERGFFSCWNCGASRESITAEELAEPAPQSGCGCGSGGCGSSACGPGVLSIELPAEWDTSLQDNDRVAERAFKAAVVGLVVPPVLLYAVAMVTKSACVPLSARGSRRFYSAFTITLAAAAAWIAVWNKFA